MKLTTELLCQAAPRARSRADAIVAALAPAMERFEITGRLRMSHFLGQMAVESGEFTRMRENLNYRPDAILRTFNTPRVRRFTPEQALEYGRTPGKAANQEMIANIAYANRMGNGGVESGDGWRYRGAGWIQLTGADNMRACGDYFGIALEQVPDWLCTPEGAALSAAWFWHTNKINQHADLDNVDGVSDAINIGKQTAKVGDAHGYDQRLLLTEIFKGANIA